jgi:hypothetical protein
MSTRHKDASHYENHPRAAELRDLAAHNHSTGEHDRKEDHQTGHEHSRQSLEHSNKAYQRSEQAHEEARTAHRATEQDVAALAFQLWQERGCPEGSPREDWYRAVEELQFRN